MEHVSFVILHFKSYELTKKCVESIIKNIQYNNYSIVVVDNGPDNDSGIQLREEYREHVEVHVIFTGYNLGFAKGNNAGYAYARNKLCADYVIAANNDTIFLQKDFVMRILAEYKKSVYYVLGPDIETLDKVHQNPYRTEVMSVEGAKRWLHKRKLLTLYLKLDNKFQIRNHIGFVNRYLMRKDEKNQKNIVHNRRQENVVLKGACIVFSPSYLAQSLYAFYPETYMYCEEDILAYQCVSLGRKMVYFPDVTVVHAEGQSTLKECKNMIHKELFMSENIVKSLKIMIKLMKKKD